ITPKMQNRLAGVAQQLHILVDNDRAVIEGVVAPGIGVLTVRVAEGVNHHPSSGHRSTELRQHGFVHIKRKMKETVPGDNQIERLVAFPTADVLINEAVLWMVLASEPDHLGRNVEAGDGISLRLQQANESAARAATHIKRLAFWPRKSQGFLQLLHSVARVDMLVVPPLGDAVVFFAKDMRIHM